MVGESNALFGDSIDIRRTADLAMRIGVKIPHADVITPDDDDVWFVRSATECECVDRPTTGPLVIMRNGKVFKRRIM
jgi:hypothetical protein